VSPTPLRSSITPSPGNEHLPSTWQLARVPLSDVTNWSLYDPKRQWTSMFMMTVAVVKVKSGRLSRSCFAQANELNLADVAEAPIAVHGGSQSMHGCLQNEFGSLLGDALRNDGSRLVDSLVKRG